VAVELPRGLLLAVGSEEAPMALPLPGPPASEPPLPLSTIPPGEQNPSNDTTPPPPPLAGTSPGKSEIAGCHRRDDYRLHT